MDEYHYFRGANAPVNRTLYLFILEVPWVYINLLSHPMLSMPIQEVQILLLPLSSQISAIYSIRLSTKLSAKCPAKSKKFSTIFQLDRAAYYDHSDSSSAPHFYEQKGDTSKCLGYYFIICRQYRLRKRLLIYYFRENRFYCIWWRNLSSSLVFHVQILLCNDTLRCL